MSGRKRRYFEADAEETPEKKRKKSEGDSDEGIERRLQSLITRVGEKSTSSLESNLETLAAVLEADLPNYRTRIVEILLQCARNLPEKACIYSTLLGLLNCRNFRFGGECVEAVFNDLKEAIYHQDYSITIILLQFMSDLVNSHVLQPTVILALYEAFLSVALEGSHIPQARSDWYVSAVMRSLPWSGAELKQRKGRELDHLMDTIDHYFRKRNASKFIGALRVWSSGPLVQEDSLDVLWSQLLAFRRAGWKEKFIVRPYLSFAPKLDDAMPHALGVLQLPSHNDDILYPQPEVVFKLFDETDIPAEGAPPLHRNSVEQNLTEEYIHSTIHRYHNDRKLCAEKLMGLGVELKTKVPLEYMIVEAIFAQLFHLPKAPYLPLFYGCLLVELCKMSPATFPQVLAQATVLLYESVSMMNITCVDRFSTWFAYHLSHFQYRWSWDDWEEVVEMDDDQPKKLFVKDMLEKVMRFAYHERLVEVLPDSYKPLIPAETKPVYKYDGEGKSLPGADAAHKLVNAIKARTSLDEVERVLEDVKDENASSSSDASTFKLEVFMQVILQVGSQSFSHSYGALAKLRPILQKLVLTDEDRVLVLRNVGEFWGNHHQLLTVYIDKLLRAGIVDGKAVVTFLFSSSMQDQFYWFYPWEILQETVATIINRASKLADQLSKCKEELQKSKEDDSKNALDEESEKTKALTGNVQKLSEDVDSAEEDIKRLFLVMAQRFVLVLQSCLDSKSPEQARSPLWLRCTLERMQQFLTSNAPHLRKYIRSLDRLIFTDDVDPKILDVYHRCRVLINCK